MSGSSPVNVLLVGPTVLVVLRAAKFLIPLCFDDGFYSIFFFSPLSFTLSSPWVGHLGAQAHGSSVLPSKGMHAARAAREEIAARALAREQQQQPRERPREKRDMRLHSIACARTETSPESREPCSKKAGPWWVRVKYPFSFLFLFLSSIEEPGLRKWVGEEADEGG